MSNTFLNSDVILKESLRVLHQKSVFIGSINKQYDDQFANSGGASGKIGETLRIRLPEQFTVTDGAIMNVQDTTARSTTLTVATRKHVAMNFTQQDLTMKIDDFSKRFIEPAMAVLAAKIESDCIGMYKDVYQAAGAINSATAFSGVLGGRQKLVNALTPPGAWNALLCTNATVDLVDTLKTLFHDSAEIRAQYRDGMMGHAAGFDFMETSHLTKHTSGSDASAYQVNGATESGATITVNTGTGTFKKGDVVTFAGCNRVHPETKLDTGELQQFVLTQDEAANATSLHISPSLVISGATQNVSGYPTNGGAVTKIGGASEPYDINLLYHPDAFTLVTADLELPQGVHFASRQKYDGISMTIVRDYNITNAEIPTRIDILYGFKTIRPELACRLHAN